MINRLKGWVFNLLRKYIIYRDNYDPNEDFVCCYCCKPLLRRYLYCSRACEAADLEEQMKR